MAVDLDPIKTRIFQLSFKKSTQGLTAEEEKELAKLKQQLALKQAAAGAGS